jgi:hypothetical protein
MNNGIYIGINATTAAITAAGTYGTVSVGWTVGLCLLTVSLFMKAVEFLK